MRVGPIFVRGNFKTTPETILEQIPLQSGGYLTTTAVERGQRNLGFLQLFNNASPISFPGKEDKREVVPMVVEVEERYEQYSVLHAGAGVSTEQKPPGFVAAVRRLRCAAATRTATSGATAGTRPPTSPTARRCCVAT